MTLIPCLNSKLLLRRKIAASRERLYRVALAWCGDAMLADDLIQETLTLALEKHHQLRDKERLYAWLYSILNNRWKQYLRSNRQLEELDENRPDEQPGPESTAGYLEIVARIQQAVSALSLEQRTVLALVSLEGFSYSDVAEILEIPAGTVMSRLHRARQRLIELLGPDYATHTSISALKRVKVVQ